MSDEEKCSKSVKDEDNDYMDVKIFVNLNEFISNEYSKPTFYMHPKLD